MEEVFLTLASPSGEDVPVLVNARRLDDDHAARYVALVVRVRARAKWEKELLSATRALEGERAESRRLANDLAARYAEEQRLREFRDALMAVVAHELRTPITTIYGMSHILRERISTLEVSAVKEHIGDIASEAGRLRRLTEDLIVLSRAEAGKLVVAPEPIRIETLLRRMVGGELARSTVQNYTLELAPDLPMVLGEELYVEQVVGNFLSNAGKYAPASSTVYIIARQNDQGVSVRVIDQGPGLGDEPPDQLFELFHRAQGAASKAAGAGIGLFVCRELIKAMGGRIWAANSSHAIARGAEFGFWMPAATEEP